MAKKQTVFERWAIVNDKGLLYLRASRSEARASAQSYGYSGATFRVVKVQVKVVGR